MLERMKLLLELFRVGKEVANPAAWKSGTVAVNTVSTLILLVCGIAATYGYVLPIDREMAATLAGIVVLVVNTVVHYITSAKVGLLKEKEEGS